MKIENQAQYEQAKEQLKKVASSVTSEMDQKTIEQLRKEIQDYEKELEWNKEVPMPDTILPAFHKLKIRPRLVENIQSGLFIPDVNNKRSGIGVIVAVGPGTNEDPMQFKVGEQVLFPAQGSMRYIENGVEYFFINQFDIIGYATLETSE
jgi:chaperonin GroES